ncbi:MAG: VOC family protein [Methanomassiliicoccaceae archaeon]|jgi:predicted enzyme related to lactoylglutathione lyase|nr:VOC family protein [Methanomassiliicoccaceae archaeon]
MPLCDPKGCNFEYTTEGLPEGMAFVEVPVKDMKRAVSFYTDILRFVPVSQSDSTSVLKMNDGCKIILTVNPGGAGKDTGIYLRTGSPFDLNRRMVDDGVMIRRHPQRGPLGVHLSFADSEGNILHVIGS